MDVSELTKSLGSYNATVNNSVDLVVGATQPLAYVIIGVFFLLELDSWYKYFKQEGGAITANLWIELALKYVLAYFMVMYSSAIFDFIVEIFNQAIKLVDGVLPATKLDFDVTTKGVSGWFFKNVVNLIGRFTDFVANLSAKLLLMMRYFQMYLLKALGPLMIAFFMADSTRPTMINFLKQFAAAALQGLILIIVIRLYPALVQTDMLKAGSGDYVTAFASIAKGIIFIFMLFGSQRLAKTLLGTS
ncbi:type IV secretion system protein [Streptococcus gallolyticus]|nr:type IV secretion system protein [Streptococcus gallolyticus]MBY5041780.1 type IV secretion system protein [Streptococcus gallolyticus]